MNAIVNPTTLHQASHQWARRPDDQRFLSLTDMLDFSRRERERSASKVVSSRSLQVRPIEGDHNALALVGADGPLLPTHWAFGQLCERTGAPASYMRKLPSPLVADCMNYGLNRSDITDIGLLSRAENPAHQLAAATGPNYGRIWNVDVIDALMQRFGNGVDGPFKVPGEFGVDVPITIDNTTLYASDRDMFVFLADETHKIEVPDRRNGQPGEMARGFFVWNSEVGSATLGIATFLFDYVCMNRIVWGVQGFNEIRIRHTASAPDKFVQEVAPAIEAYSHGTAASVVQAIENGRKARLDDVDSFLKQRFNANQARAIQLAHTSDEGRPIETVWDAVTGITAYARGIKFQDERVAVERIAGKLMDKVATL